MFNILREFYLSNLSPSENLTPEHLLYKEKSKLANEAEGIFLSKLSDEEKAWYTEMMNNRALTYSEEVVTAFTDGFVLGFLFLEEITKRRRRYEDS